MKRIAAPLVVGDHHELLLLELTVYPAIFAIWKGRRLAREGAAEAGGLADRRRELYRLSTCPTGFQNPAGHAKLSARRQGDGVTKLLQKAIDEAAKLPERDQDALGSLLLDEIAVERRREHQSAGMPWEEIRARYPHQWLLLEATEAHSSRGQRILESLTVLETFPDGLSAMRRYGETHGQDPHRELYVLHTDRETVEIEEVHWAGIRAAS